MGIGLLPIEMWGQESTDWTICEIIDQLDLYKPKTYRLVAVWKYPGEKNTTKFV